MIIQAGPVRVGCVPKGLPLCEYKIHVCAAKAQERAISISKARADGHYIPLPRGKRRKARR